MSREWFYTDSGLVLGPLTVQELRHRIVAGRLPPESYIRFGRHGNVAMAKNVKRFLEILGKGETHAPQKQLAELASELSKKIPEWLKAVSMKWSTGTYGIVAKSSNYVEQMLRRTAFLLAYDVEKADTPASVGHGKSRATIGELVRQIKTQQTRSVLFQDADKAVVGMTFGQLETIVALRNAFVHVDFSNISEKLYNDLVRYLQTVHAFSNSWLVSLLAGLPR